MQKKKLKRVFQILLLFLALTAGIVIYQQTTRKTVQDDGIAKEKREEKNTSKQDQAVKKEFSQEEQEKLESQPGVSVQSDGQVHVDISDKFSE